MLTGHEDAKNADAVLVHEGVIMGDLAEEEALVPFLQVSLSLPSSSVCGDAWPLLIASASSPQRLRALFVLWFLASSAYLLFSAMRI